MHGLALHVLDTTPNEGAPPLRRLQGVGTSDLYRSELKFELGFRATRPFAENGHVPRCH